MTLFHPLLLYPFLLIQIVASLLAASLPALLAPNDTISRRSVYFVSAVVTCAAALFISTSLLVIPSAITQTLNERAAFLIALITPLILDRAVIALTSRISGQTVVDDTADDVHHTQHIRRAHNLVDDSKLYDASPLTQTHFPSYTHVTHAIPPNAARSYLGTNHFIARCMFCKDAVTMHKTLAYHQAGCPHAVFGQPITVDSAVMQAVRGKTITDGVDGFISAGAVTYYAVTRFAMAAIIGVTTVAPMNAYDTAIVATMSVVFNAYHSFILSLFITQCRTNTFAHLVASLVHSLGAPAGILIAQMIDQNALSTNDADMIISVVPAIGAGLALYVGYVGILIDEVNTTTAGWIKWIFFAATIIVVAYINSFQFGTLK